MTGCRTYSFEPEALNYSVLNQNIHINNLHDQVRAYCVAISDSDHAGIGDLLLGAFGYSYSHHDFDENTWVKDKSFGSTVTQRDQRFIQGCVSYSVDQLVASGVIPAPNHIKVDVDGLERKVFEGMRKTLVEPQLKTVLFEIDFAIDSATEIVDKMMALGWRFEPMQLCANRKTIFSMEQIEVMRTKKSGGFNYIFYKDEYYSKMFFKFMENYVPPLAKKK